MLLIDKLIKTVGFRPDVVFTATHGDGADVIYIPENGSIVDFFHNQKFNNKVNTDSILVPNRLTVNGSTIINNVAYTKMKSSPELRGFNLVKTIPRGVIQNKIRYIDTSPFIGEIVTLAHTRSITGVYNDFFKLMFSVFHDMNVQTAKVKNGTDDYHKKISRLKIVLIDLNLSSGNLKNGFTSDFDYFLKMNKYQLNSKTFGEHSLLPDAIIYKVNNNYFCVAEKVLVIDHQTEKLRELNHNPEEILDKTKFKNESYLKINRMAWENVLKVYNHGSMDILSKSKIDNAKMINDKILGFKSPKNINTILDIGNDIAKLQEKNKDDSTKLTQDIKKLIEGNPNLSDLEGTTFGEKLQNFYYGLKHAEKIQIQRGLVNNIDPEKEEKIPDKIKLENAPNEKLVSKLTNEEKALVKKFNGTVFIEEMQERSNFGIRSYNPDNIVKLTEFSGYKKQETEFQNNLDENMEDLIKSMEKDKELGIKVLNIKPEIKDNNKTRFKRFTTQIQHSNFGQTFKGKYSFIMDVPYPIEGKYIKFGGNDYVMVNQLFNKPIQKVNNQLVRLYTHYNTTSVSLKNSKFNGVYGLDNLEKEIIVTIKNTGPKIGVDIKTTPIGSISQTTSPLLDILPRTISSKFKYLKVEISKKENKLFKWEFDFSSGGSFFTYTDIDSNISEYAKVDMEGKIIHYYAGTDHREFPLEALDEFIMGQYNRLAKNILKTDIIKKSKSSVPYFSAKIIGYQIPVSVLVISNLGFTQAMNLMDLKWTFQDKKIITKDKDKSHLGMGGEPQNIQFKNGYLTVYPKTIKQRGLAAGLTRYKQKANVFIDSPDLYKVALEESFGAYGYKKLMEAIPKIIDNTTEKILKEYGYPTDILTLYSDTIPGMMLTRDDSHFENLDYYRIRLSEAISHIGYNQLQQALSELKRKKDFKDHKLFIKPEFIMSKLLEAGIFQNAKTINPIEEMMLSQKIVKTGIGNVKKSQVTLARRDLNPSYFGVISPTATNEYGGIGSNQTLTNGTTIKDRFGTIKTKAYNNEDNPFNMLAPVESLTPFFERDDTTRRIMGNQQTGQFTQLENPDEPLVQTGFESYIPWLVSDRFTKKSKIHGTCQFEKSSGILKIIGTGSDIGKTQIVSLKHARSRTKRGVYLLNKYTPTVNEGQSVKPNTILAATDSLKTGKLAVGKNLVIAEMPYNGMNYEDGWVISGATVPQKYSNKYLQKLTMMIPDNVKITKLGIEKNKITQPGDILLEFQKEDYHIQNLDLDLEQNDSDDILYGLEQHRGTSKYFSPGGKILDFVVRLNTQKPDAKIKTLWNESIKDLNVLKGYCELESKNIEDPKARNQAQMDCLGNVDGIASLAIGGHKIGGEEPGTGIIEVFIERENPISNGSKFTLGNSGGKGTVQYIIPPGKEPVAIESQLKIDFIPTSLSIIKRKNPSIIFNMYLGKCMFFINELMKGMLKDKPDDIARIASFVLGCYALIDKTTDNSITKEIESFFKQDKVRIQKAINQSNSLSKPLFAGIVPPFMNSINMRDIVRLSKHIGIPLKEKVMIHENGPNGSITMKKVPVGILNVFLLEHFPHTQGSVRGSMYVKSSIVTGQGSSGSKDRKGATKAGLYDLYSILTKRPYYLIKELHSLKSDAKMAKHQYNKQIFDGIGSPSIADIKLTKDDTTTKNYIEALFLGAGLKTFY